MKDAKIELNGVKTVVFDLDGTLYNKQGLAARLTSRLWWCLPLLAAERRARKNMHYFRYASQQEFFTAFFRQMARGHWWSVGIAEKWYNHVYMPTMVRLIGRYHRPRPQIIALLDECKRMGLQMAVYSDYGCVEEKMEALGIDTQPFELLVSAPELGALKPSETCAAAVMEMLHAEPETTLFVGDRDEKDGASARAVGARFMLVGNDQ